jgi:N-acyl amino acid synthase of PEP-CTERM/exosortase system
MSFTAEATGAADTPPGLTLTHRDLAREYRGYFGLARARSPALRDEAFAIRHAVYCEELGLMPVRADGRHQDEYDDDAEHLLLGSVTLSRYIACARLVLPGLARSLPVEEACGRTLGARWEHLKRHRRVAELSGLAAIAEFRRRRGERARDLPIGEADFGTEARPRFPYIPVSLCLGALALARELRVDVVVVLTDSEMATQLARLGIGMQRIGEPLQQQGTRAPYTLDVDGIVTGLKAFVRPLYEAIASDVGKPA